MTRFDGKTCIAQSARIEECLGDSWRAFVSSQTALHSNTKRADHFPKAWLSAINSALLDGHNAGETKEESQQA